jgi:hypothetical protein
MSLTLTAEWLAGAKACAPGVEFWKKQKESDPKEALARALREKEYEIATWVLHKIVDDKVAFTKRLMAVLGPGYKVTPEGCKKFLEGELGKEAVNV